MADGRDVLVLGGTVFLGRAMATVALAAGHRVTVFNRGRSGSAPEGAEQVTGDRTDPAGLERLRGRRFDLVIDTSGYVPAEVGRGAAVLRGGCGHYVFISSVNAFPAWPARADYQAAGTYDGDPDATPEDVPADVGAEGSYGWLKVGCERTVVRAFGDMHVTILRAGCIVGPHDSAVGRLPWWIDRIARGGEVLVPGAPGDPIALVDARDVAAFALAAVPGVFETGGPSGRDLRGELITACREVTGSDASFTYVGDDWPVAQGVTPWTELPLWAPAAPGLFAHDNTAAAAAGFTWRPLRDTVSDTWGWQRSVEWAPAPRTPGLAAEREAQLLRAWHT